MYKRLRRGGRYVFKPTRLSIVTPVLDSHAIVRRLLLYYKALNLPDDIEIILVDDNSNPPLKPIFEKKYNVRNLYIYPTGDPRPWTIACARNLGIKLAQGEYVFNTDIDHIISKEAIEASYNFDGDKMFFGREYGILDNKGVLRQDKETLFKYGLSKDSWRKRGVRRYHHVGTHVVRRSILKELDGYPIRTCDYGTHPTREDRLMYHRYLRHSRADKCESAIMNNGAKVYCFPGMNSRGLFHHLERKSRADYAAMKARRRALQKKKTS